MGTLWSVYYLIVFLNVACLVSKFLRTNIDYCNIMRNALLMSRKASKSLNLFFLLINDKYIVDSLKMLNNCSPFASFVFVFILLMVFTEEDKQNYKQRSIRALISCFRLPYSPPRL